MKDLIEALTIIQKYMTEDVYAPLHCEHDVLYVLGDVDYDEVSEEDKERLKELSFTKGEFGGFQSYRFGSC